MEAQKSTDGIKIRISGLSNGVYEYHFSVLPSEIGLESRFHQPISINVTLDKATRQILLRAAMTSSAQVVCDRCTDEFVQSLEATYTMLYVYDEESTGKFPPEEVTVLRPDAVHIDLAGDVREIVTLSVPLKLLCREDCKGLCPQCGTNWNTGSCACKNEMKDSRWQGLEKLLKN
jgi:uncharacterized protein